MHKFIQNQNKVDKILFGIIVILLCLGMLMVYSSSYIWSEYKFNDSFYYLKRQLLFAGIGFIGMIVISYFPYYMWKKYAKILLFACFALLILVLIPGIGMVRGGAQSWIGIGAFSIQPSEFMKLGLIIFLASILSDHQKYITSFKRGSYRVCF